MAEITCVLNVWRRFYTFREQLEAVKRQTIPPKHIIVWNNSGHENYNTLMEIAADESNKMTVITCSRNMGVWARFYALYPLLSGEYVCVFDDDTIPGHRWFENCVTNMKKYNALLGTVGVTFGEGYLYHNERRKGWCSNNTSSEFVDIVGHSWFFKREWITTITRDLPNIDERFLKCGEDMHLSYALRKYLFVPTIVPPHPDSDTTIWGADKARSIEYGNQLSTFCELGGSSAFSVPLKHYRDNGFETIRTRETRIKKYGNCLNYFIEKIRNREPFALLRFADGEHAVLQNTTLTNCDNWTFTSGSILHTHLTNSLKNTRTNVYYGISGPSDSRSIFEYYWNAIENKGNMTFANVLVNQNHKRWLNFLSEYDSECVLISCRKPDSGSIGRVKIIEHICIPEKLVDTWSSEYEKYFCLMYALAARYTGMLFFICAGPISEVFIDKLYQVNPRNTYIDAGSSLDVIMKNTYTRTYQQVETGGDVQDIPNV